LSEVDRPLTAEVAEQLSKNGCGRRSEEVRGRFGVVGFSTSETCLKSLWDAPLFSLQFCHHTLLASTKAFVCARSDSRRGSLSSEAI
jgi:hypothetical protein